MEQNTQALPTFCQDSAGTGETRSEMDPYVEIELAGSTLLREMRMEQDVLVEYDVQSHASVTTFVRASNNILIFNPAQGTAATLILQPVLLALLGLTAPLELVNKGCLPDWDKGQSNSQCTALVYKGQPLWTAIANKEKLHAKLLLS
eukprot:371066-Pelagomonas_calceolata.AAC.3